MVYKVINMLNGAVIIVDARNKYRAMSKGRKHFSEPNRTKIPVQVFN